jgi:hypothetical protein
LTLVTFFETNAAMKKIALLLSVLVLGGLAAKGQTGTPSPSPTASPSPSHDFSFDMVLSTQPVGFKYPKAGAHVNIHSAGVEEVMEVKVFGLPPNTDFDFFVIQKPTAKFGLSWYQGDIETDNDGNGFALFFGRFNIETFIVSPGPEPAPVIFEKAFPDAFLSVQVGRIHTYHLGLWFNSPADALKAGALGTTTPFNGEGNAGVQVLNTANFPDLAGPLINVD